MEQALSPDIKLNNPENLLDTIEFLRDESNGALYIVKNHTKPIGVGIIYDYSSFIKGQNWNIFIERLH